MPNSYLTWIEANDKLSKCMAASDASAYKSMSADQQASVCRTEGDAVRSLLSSDSVSFRNLLTERMSAVKQWTHFDARYCLKMAAYKFDGKKIEELGLAKRNEDLFNGTKVISNLDWPNTAFTRLTVSWAPCLPICFSTVPQSTRAMTSTLYLSYVFQLI